MRGSTPTGTPAASPGGSPSDSATRRPHIPGAVPVPGKEASATASVPEATDPGLKFTEVDTSGTRSFTDDRAQSTYARLVTEAHQDCGAVSLHVGSSDDSSERPSLCLDPLEGKDPASNTEIGPARSAEWQADPKSPMCGRQAFHRQSAMGIALSEQHSWLRQKVRGSLRRGGAVEETISS